MCVLRTGTIFFFEKNFSRTDSTATEKKEKDSWQDIPPAGLSSLTSSLSLSWFLVMFFLFFLLISFYFISGLLLCVMPGAYVTKEKKLADQ